MQLNKSFKNLKGIYQIICKSTNKIYIGATFQSFARRLQGHVCQLTKNKHPNNILQNHWNKYGSENFIFQPLEFIDLKESLEKAEQWWIDILEPQLNVMKNVNGISRWKISQKGKTRSEIVKERMTEEVREHLSKIQRSNEKIRGENSGGAKLFEHEVIKIIELARKGESVKSLATLYKVGEATIRSILSGKNWKHLNIERKPKIIHKLNKELAAEIRKLSKEGKSARELAHIYQVTRSSIWSVLSNKSYKY